MFIVCPCLKKREILGTIWTRGSRTLGIRKLGKLYKLIDLWQWGSKSFVFEKFSRWLWNNRFRNLWSRFYWDHFLEASHWLKTASCCWVAESCLTLCNPMDWNMPGVPVLHYFLEFAQTRVHWVGDAIQPSHPLSPPSPPALKSFPESESFPMNQLFTSGGQSIGASASVLPMDIHGGFPLGLTSLISLQSKGLSRVFSSSTIWKRQFFSTQPSLWSKSHICTQLMKKP